MVNKYKPFRTIEELDDTMIEKHVKLLADFQKPLLNTYDIVKPQEVVSEVVSQPGTFDTILSLISDFIVYTG